MRGEKPKQYHIAIDLMRALAIIAVVFIHTTTKVLAISHFDLENFSFILFLNQAARFAVPLFFMISGFVLELRYPYHASYFVYLKKRFSRILIPYLFWSFIYFFFVFNKHSFSSFFLNALPTGGSSYQLYFIPTLIIFYIIFPFIHKWYHIFAHKGVFILLGIIQLVLLYFDYYVHALHMYSILHFAVLNYFPFLLGVYASHHTERISTVTKRWYVGLIALLAGFALFVFLEGKILYEQTKNYLSFYSQWRPSILLYTTVLAAVLYTFFNEKTKYYTFIRILSNLSFFVFFVHVVVLENVWNRLILQSFTGTNNLVIKQFVYTPIFILLTVSISFLIAYVAHRIPKLEKITG